MSEYKIHIYEDLPTVSGSWHAGGGAVIVCAGDPQAAWARAFVAEPEIAGEVLPVADKIFDVVAGEESVTVFPDAGCC